MNDVVQYIIAGLIVAVAVVAAVRSFMNVVKSKKSALTACATCKLKEACRKPEKNSAKKCADKVAQLE